MRAALIGMIAAVFFLAGCAGTGAPNKPDAQETTPASAAASTQPTREAPPPPPTSALGDEVNLVAIKATVIEYKEGVLPAETADSGQRWDGALVKICNLKFADPNQSEVIFSWSSWELRDDDDGSYDATTITYLQFPSPSFPNGDPVAVNKCAKGWVVFAVTKDAKIVGAALAIGDQEDQNVWSVPS